MFELVIVEGGSRESVLFVTRLDEGEVTYHNVARFGEHCIICDMCGIGAYVKG